MDTKNITTVALELTCGERHQTFSQMDIVITRSIIQHQKRILYHLRKSFNRHQFEKKSLKLRTDLLLLLGASIYCI